MNFLKKVPGAVWVVLFVLVLGGLLSLRLRDRPEAGRPVIDATTKPGRVTVKIDGAVEFDYRGTARVQLVSSGGGNVPANLHLLSLAIIEPLESGTTKLSVGFNLYGYEGGSKGTIPSLEPSPSAAGLRSTAFVTVFTPASRRFDQPVSACSLNLRDGGRAGDLTCPAIADAIGARVSLRMEWDIA